MRDIYVLFCLFDKNSATSLSYIILRIKGRNKLSQIAYIGEVVELAEPYIQIQSFLLMYSLKISLIGISTLLEIGIGVLPV